MNKQKNQHNTQDSKLDKNESKEKSYAVRISINEDKGIKIIKKSNYITTYELAKQTNVKLSTANQFLQKMLNKKIIRKISGHSGHYVYTAELS